MNEQLKPFQQVLVRDSEDRQWTCSFYSHYDTRYMVHICANGRDYKYCIPYEGNEELLGTTDVPKPKRWRAKRDEYFYFINANGVVSSTNDIGADANNSLFNIGNYFKTKEEAEEMANKFKSMLKGE